MSEKQMPILPKKKMTIENYISFLHSHGYRPAFLSVSKDEPIQYVYARNGKIREAMYHKFENPVYFGEDYKQEEVEVTDVTNQPDLVARIRKMTIDKEHSELSKPRSPNPRITNPIWQNVGYLN